MPQAEVWAHLPHKAMSWPTTIEKVNAPVRVAQRQPKPGLPVLPKRPLELGYSDLMPSTSQWAEENETPEASALVGGRRRSLSKFEGRQQPSLRCMHS
jgi:hypothetical protein